MTLARGVRADRAAVFYLQGERLELGGVSGMPEFSTDDCPISVSVVKSVIDSNRNLVYSNVPQDADARDNVSLQLSGAISVLCVPFYDQGGKPAGALYADTTQKTKAFYRKELLFARDCASWLEGCLSGSHNMPKPEIEIVETSISTVVKIGEKAEVAAAGGRDKTRRAGLVKSNPDRVGGTHLMVFFRSLATLTQAGVNIDASLHLLGESSEDKVMGEVAKGLAEAVFRGEPLSAAMERYPNTFSSQVRSVVRVGERSGRFVHVLQVLSNDLEKSQRLIYRLRSALTYPAMLALACGLMLLFGPPYLLQGHLRVLLDSKVPLPMLTQGLVLLSKAVSSPVFLVLATLAVGATVAAARSPRGKEKLLVWGHRSPVLGPILSQLALTQFSRSLALQTKAGMTAMEALAQARQGCQEPGLREAIRQAEVGLRNGDSLKEALEGTKFFPPIFLSFVEAGEQTGTLVRLTEWLADFYETELEASLSRFVALAEPLIMAFMGLVTALLLIATLKPTLLILQTL